MRILAGLVLFTLGLAGAWDGPIDRAYAQDWALWLLFVLVGIGGLVLVVT